jgi:hypothetical protein
MLSDFLKKNIESQADYIKANGFGYGQVEPNHLSAQATKEVYAQLPANKDIKILENGQFAKYDYANEEVNFSGAGEWLLVFNEIKLYREGQVDAEFAMIKDNYQARVYSPFDGNEVDKQARYYNGKDSDGNDIEDVTAGPDYYEVHYNEDPFHFLGKYKEKLMPEGTTMVPRLLKTHVGDIYTTNMIGEEDVDLEDELSPRSEDGILSKSGDESIVFQVVKKYTMPDGQPGVKLMRIK